MTLAEPLFSSSRVIGERVILYFFYFLSIFFNMLVGLSLTVNGFKFAELFPGKEKIVKIMATKVTNMN